MQKMGQFTKRTFHRMKKRFVKSELAFRIPKGFLELIRTCALVLVLQRNRTDSMGIH